MIIVDINAAHFFCLLQSPKYLLPFFKEMVRKNLIIFLKRFLFLKSASIFISMRKKQSEFENLAL